MAGTNYRIVLEGATGSSQTFTVTSSLSDSDLGFHDSANGNSQNNSGLYSAQNPADAVFTFNGLSITRSVNLITDVISGVSFSLNASHSGGASTTINVVSDQSTLKTKLQSLVTTYNDVTFALDEISNPDSEEEEVGGALARDLSVIRTVRDTIYQAITQGLFYADYENIKGLRDVGVTLTGYGGLQFNEATYDAAAASNFNDIAQMISAGTTDQSRYDGQSQGLAIDAIKKLEVLTDSISGVFATRTQSAQVALTTYSEELADLELRMEALYERYWRNSR